MEWIETTGRTVDEAKEAALDRLGVAPEDAEFEVLEEPKSGLFGRTRGEARVRARVRPALARQKLDRRRRGSSSGRGDGDATAPASAARPSGPAQKPAQKPAKTSGRSSTPRPAREDASPAGTVSSESTAAPRGAAAQGEHVVDAQQVGEEARRFMVGLLDAFGAEGAVDVVRDGDDLEVRVVGDNLGLLVGPRGTTLQAVQDLARVAAQRRLGDHDTRLRVDVGGYRERRREALGRFAVQMADEVRASGVARVLEPMSSADRKIIHDTLSGVEGIETRSEGDDPQRRVVIEPASGASA
ncbi:MAG: RNA-binding cell elongation regulator Jag/EloR [Ilumatobacteraceae bacterium]